MNGGRILQFSHSSPQCRLRSHPFSCPSPLPSPGYGNLTVRANIRTNAKSRLTVNPLFRKRELFTIGTVGQSEYKACHVKNLAPMQFLHGLQVFRRFCPLGFSQRLIHSAPKLRRMSDEDERRFRRDRATPEYYIQKSGIQ